MVREITGALKRNGDFERLPHLCGIAAGGPTASVGSKVDIRPTGKTRHNTTFSAKHIGAIIDSAEGKIRFAPVPLASAPIGLRPPPRGNLMFHLPVLSAPLYAVVAFGLFAVALGIFSIAQRDYRKYRMLPWRTVLLLLVLFVVVCPVMGYLGGLGPWPRPKEPLVLYWMGTIVGAFGILSFLVASVNLGLERTFCHKVDTVVQSGMYRFSRNPQLLFGILAFSGIALASLSWNGLIFALQFAAVGHAMVLFEEEHLRHALGANYVAYCAKTPRYIGIRSFRRK